MLLTSRKSNTSLSNNSFLPSSYQSWKKHFPNCTYVLGLITDKVKPKYDKLGVLSYQEMEDNFQPDWAEISKPYETQEEIEKAIGI